MSINEILNIEKENTCIVFLYREGLFYKMYEHSAFLFCKYVQPFKVTKRRFKSAGCQVASMGFPSHLLDRWRNGFKVEETDGCARIFLNEDSSFCEAEFEKWKEAVAEKPSACKEQVSNPSPRLQLIAEKLRAFPVEIRTPMECMSLVCELKQLC